MIIYDNRDIYFIVFRKAGSVLFTKMVLLPSILSTILCAVFLYLSQDKPIVLVSSSVARVYSTILGFVIVFRTSMAFGRFFEGISHVQMLFSKWRDAFASLMAFTECSIAFHAERDRRDHVKELMLSKARLLHWFSLLSAISVQELQGEEEDDDETETEGPLDQEKVEVNRLCIIKRPTNRLQIPPGGETTAPLNGARKGRMRSSGVGVMLEKASMRGHTVFDSATESSDDIVFTKIPGSGRAAEEACGNRRVVNGIRVSTNSLISVPRSNMEGPGSRRSSQGPRRSISSRHSVSADSAFNSEAPTEISGDLYTSERTTAPRLTPAAEANEDQKRRAICVIGELTPQEFTQLRNSDDHVLTVIKWIVREMSYQIMSGKLLIGPPIASRVYQELSNGMLAFSMVKIKIATVPFPFPFAQVLSYALYAFYVLCPFIVLEIMDRGDPSVFQQIGIPLLMNFTTCTGYGAVNEIAIELEEPFGFDANDYPVHCQQTMIVRAMEDTYFASAPRDFTIGHFAGVPCGPSGFPETFRSEASSDSATI